MNELILITMKFCSGVPNTCRVVCVKFYLIPCNVQVRSCYFKIFRGPLFVDTLYFSVRVPMRAHEHCWSFVCTFADTSVKSSAHLSLYSLICYCGSGLEQSICHLLIATLSRCQSSCIASNSSVLTQLWLAYNVAARLWHFGVGLSVLDRAFLFLEI